MTETTVGIATEVSLTCSNCKFLDLPHSHTFKKKSFRCLQLAICSTVKPLSDEAMQIARDEEIIGSLGKQKFDAYKNNLLTPKEVPLTVSYDMGWNKRSSGNKYDSISGHDFIMGGFTKKVLNHRCLSKCCSLCDNKRWKNLRNLHNMNAQRITKGLQKVWSVKLFIRLLKSLSTNTNSPSALLSVIMIAQ